MENDFSLHFIALNLKFLPVEEKHNGNGNGNGTSNGNDLDISRKKGKFMALSVENDKKVNGKAGQKLHFSKAGSSMVEFRPS
jgi:hypothetical protein